VKRCVILGAGLIGQQFVRLLDVHPYFELTEVVASDKSEGQSLKSKWNLPSFEIPGRYDNLRLSSLRDLDPNSYDIVFSALPASMAKKIELEMAQNGKSVFSNASAYRYEPNVPILIPEINATHLEIIKHQDSFDNNGFIVTNSNCTVSGLAMLLNEIRQVQQIKNVYVSSYQALSGAGFEGLESIPRDRVIPFIKDEEEKISIEARKILGSVNHDRIVHNTEINEVLATCARVPVIDGHLEAVTIEFRTRLDSTAIQDHLEHIRSDLSLPTAPSKPIKLFKDLDRPQSALDLYDKNGGRSSGMVVSISPIRFTKYHLRCFLLVHNTIRGGAGGSILNAELAYSRGFL